MNRLQIECFSHGLICYDSINTRLTRAFRCSWSTPFWLTIGERSFGYSSSGNSRNFGPSFQLPLNCSLIFHEVLCRQRLTPLKWLFLLCDFFGKIGLNSRAWQRIHARTMLVSEKNVISSNCSRDSSTMVWHNQVTGKTAWSSKPGVSLDFAATNRITKDLSVVCHLMYARIPQASVDASVKMQCDGLQSYHLVWTIAGW